MQINVTTYESRPITVTEHSGSITCAPECSCSGIIHLATTESAVNLETQRVEVTMNQYNKQLSIIEIDEFNEEIIRSSELAIAAAKYAKEMGDRAKEIIDSGGVGQPHHEVTVEEMNAILDKIDEEDDG